MTMQTIEDVREALAGMEVADSESALVLLSAAVVGANIDRVHKFTSIPRERVREYAGRLRESGIWAGGHLHVDWQDEENGGIAFLMDTLVADGLLARAPRS